MKTIVISGTPGCGKTSVAKTLKKNLNAEVIYLNKLALSKNLSLKYDKYRETYIVDINEFLPILENQIEKIQRFESEFLIIEGHFSDVVPERLINYIFILRCDPDELYKRLKKKKYKLKKIRENIQAEILGNCINHFIQKGIKIPLFEIDTTHKNIETIAEIIMDIVVGGKNTKNYKVGKIDWLENLFKEDRLNDFFD